MNRAKKIKQSLKKINKSVNAKKTTKKKGTYVCKADRAAAELLKAEENTNNEQAPE